jgi:outer membrane receptor for ferrienterochelin and colicins
VEINLQGNLLGELLSFGLGYTYTDPWDLDLNRFLPFRPRHLLYSTNTLNFYKMSIGIDYRYISKYDRIDEKLALVVPDAGEQVAAHIVDFRIVSPTIFVGIPARMIFQVRNVLQYNYLELVGSLAPPRQFILSLEGGI